MPRGRLPCATPCPSTRPCPRSRPEQVPEVLARFDGCTTAKVKVAERGQTLDDDVDRVAAVRSAMGPCGADPGRRQRRLGRRDGRRGAAAAHGIRPRVRRAAVRHGRGARRAANGAGAQAGSTSSSPPTSRSARRRTRSAWPGSRPPTSSSSRWRRSVAWRRALEVVEACGLPAVVSSALDTSVGIAAGVALAAALPVARPRVRSGHRGPLRARRLGVAVAPDGRGPGDGSCRAGPAGSRRSRGTAGAAAVVARPARPLPCGARRGSAR